MKRDAINRIIIWSLVLVIMLGLLIFGLNWQNRRMNLISEATLSSEENSSSSRIPATVITDSWLYSSPNLSANQQAQLPAGTAVAIARHELINGTEWAFVDSPETGWIPMDNLDAADSTIIEDASLTNSPDIYVFKPKEITDIKIDWLSGSIWICPSAEALGIEVQESHVSDSQYQLVCRQDGSTLIIDYCEENLWNLNPPKKDLTIKVPTDFALHELEVDAASAALDVTGMTIQDVEIDTASGKSTFQGCNVEFLDVDTTSGDISFEGSLNRLDCDSASAGVQATLDNVPEAINIDTASGSLELCLPENTGFSVSMDTMSGKFDSTFPTTVKNGRYVCGDGACQIDMSSMSGGVTICSK